MVEKRYNDLIERFVKKPIESVLKKKQDKSIQKNTEKYCKNDITTLK